MRDAPQYFRLDGGYGSFGRRGWVHGSVFHENVKLALAQSPSCPECGRRRSVRSLYETSTRVDIIVNGGDRWPDVLNGYSAHVTVTDRVLDSLHRAGITTFRAIPATIIHVSGTRLTKRSAPRYSMILPDVGIEIDKVRSGCRLGALLCPTCGHRDNHPHGPSGQRWGLHAVPGSHSGAHLFGSRDTHEYVFCTRHVLEIARVDRWTGARFTPMDIHPKMAFGWTAIDYLGKPWPPKAWYPPAPDAGKTPQEWAAQLETATQDFERLKAGVAAESGEGKPGRPEPTVPHPLERRLLAIQALEWLGASAVPLLTSLMRGADRAVARDAAFVLGLIVDLHDVDLQPDVLRLAAALWPHGTLVKR